MILAFLFGLCSGVAITTIIAMTTISDMDTQYTELFKQNEELRRKNEAINKLIEK